ncbi:hypothetical protein AB3X91_17445 [Paraburkholderia sp. BR14263]|uniref:hypothetical protein n=1 Tax=unclassified Paraburkholderia TaxID=2615204 RepID=UPI0034CD446C
MFAAHAHSHVCIELLALVSDVDAKDTEGRCAAQIAAEVGEQAPLVSTRDDVFADFFYRDVSESAHREHDPYWRAPRVHRIEQEALRRAAARGMNTSSLSRAENAGRSTRRL